MIGLLVLLGDAVVLDTLVLLPRSIWTPMIGDDVVVAVDSVEEGDELVVPPRPTEMLNTGDEFEDVDTPVLTDVEAEEVPMATETLIMADCDDVPVVVGVDKVEEELEVVSCTPTETLTIGD